MKIYATYNIKGGVGKTTTAVNLAYLAATESGLRTVLWDLDPQGAASFMFRVKPRVKGGGKALIRGTRALDDAIKGTDFDNLDLIPADFTYRNMDLLLDSAGGKPGRKLAKLLAPLAAEYDAVFLDCPPGISLVSENVLHAADVIVVPLIPTTLSVRTLDQLTEFVAEFDGRRPDVLAFFSMVDRRKKLHREITENFPSERARGGRDDRPRISRSWRTCRCSAPRSRSSRRAAQPPAPTVPSGPRSRTAPSSRGCGARPVRQGQPPPGALPLVRPLWQPVP